MVGVLEVYIGITVIFTILLVIMAVTGGLSGAFDVGGVDVGGPDIDVGGGDIGHDVATDAGQFSGSGISPLSLPIMFAFGAFFGAFGTILEATAALPPIAVPFSAGAVAAVITAILYFVMQVLFAKAQATTSYKAADLVGTNGEVTIPIEPGVRGQVLLITEARGRTLLSAISKVPLKTGDRVTVTGVEGGAVVVEKA